MLRKCLLLFLLLLSFSAEAKELKFATSPQWLGIGHYHKKWYGYEATIGSDNFYLSPQGRNDPQKELEATIELFHSSDNQTKCRFPARYQLLSHAGLVHAPFPKCQEYEQFIADLQPAGVTLLFTDAYMNNSSSLFGHTLLRIDTKRKGTQLLAHGLNYGAYTEGVENNALYAIYGIFGAFPAGFTVKPYYDIINTYNNIENRDIWEYNLDLTPAEIDLMVAHLWEIGQTTTPYYFFTKNCSYMLMEVFDAVRPQLQLSESFWLKTIPLDTIKKVNQKEGFVKSVNYRPSRRRKIEHRISQMDPAQYQAFLQAVHKEKLEMDDLPKEKRADVLETAYQYVQYQYIARQLRLSEYRSKSFKLLKKRNQERGGQKFNEVIEGQNPVFAHNSAEIAFGVGVYNRDHFQQIKMRPAYHSLTDRPYGYLPGAEINFLETVIRHYDHKDKYVLQQLNVLELASLSPVSAVFKAPSYRISMHIKRTENPQTGDEGYVLNGSAGGGVSYGIGRSVLFYGVGSLEGAYGGFLPQNQWGGVGVAGGMIWGSDTFSVNGEVKKVWASDKIGTSLVSSVAINYYLSTQLAIETVFIHTDNHGKNFNEYCSGIKYFF